jgi:hypothetical protein
VSVILERHVTGSDAYQVEAAAGSYGCDAPQLEMPARAIRDKDRTGGESEFLLELLDLQPGVKLVQLRRERDAEHTRDPEQPRNKDHELRRAEAETPHVGKTPKRR